MDSRLRSGLPISATFTVRGSFSTRQPQSEEKDKWRVLSGRSSKLITYLRYCGFICYMYVVHMLYVYVWAYIDFTSFEYIPKSEMPESYCISIFKFMRNLLMFVLMVVPVHIPTNSVTNYLFLHVLFRICYFLIFACRCCN